MKKYTKQSELNYGSVLDSGFLALVKEVEENGQKTYYLQDRTGEVQALIPATLTPDGLESCVGNVYDFGGTVLVRGRAKMFAVSSMKRVEKYPFSEIFNGLSEEKKESMKAYVKSYMERVSHPGYKALLRACLTDEVLDKLANVPATLDSHATYAGGALVLSATALTMSGMLMSGYLKHGYYTALPANYNLLYTAAMLLGYGCIDYYVLKNDPKSGESRFEKTTEGVIQNYFSLLQDRIRSVVLEKVVQIDERDLGILLNVLEVSTRFKTGTKSITREGTILRHVVSMFSELDMVDTEINRHETSEERVEGEEYWYSKKLDRYFLADSEKGDE